MVELEALGTMVVDVAPSLPVGIGPAGDRSVGAITAVTLSGERLRATQASPAAADWLVRTGAVGVIDARVLLRTDDDALIYLQYGGRLDLSDPASGMWAYVALTFETGDPCYAWLNKVQGVGKGRLSMSADGSGRLDYAIAAVR